jgi:hypothetical protein
MPHLITNPRFAPAGATVQLVGYSNISYSGFDGDRTFPLSGAGWTTVDGTPQAGNAIVLLYMNYNEYDPNEWDTAPPSGWTTHLSLDTTAANVNEGAVASRDTGLTSGEVSGGSFTVTLPSTWNISRQIALILRNVDPADPIDVAAAEDGNPITASPVTIYAPAVTPTGSGNMVFQTVVCQSGTGADYPSDFFGTRLCEIIDDGTSWLVNYSQTDSAVSRNSCTITGSDYAGYVGQSFVVKAG